MSHESWIVLLGGNPLNAGVRELARRVGARLLVVDWNENPAIPGDLHIRLDIKDTSAVLAALKDYVPRILLAYTSADVATGTVVAIHSAVGLAGPSDEALEAARNKSIMNGLWDKAGLLQKRHSTCRSAEDLVTFQHQVAGDIIVKPESGSSSRGITALRGGDALDSQLVQVAWRRAVEGNPHGRVLAEEYVDGTEFTVEMVGDTHGNVHVWAVSKKYHTVNAGRNRVATKLHYNAPDVDFERQARIAAFARNCYRTLGLRASLGHFEVFERRSGLGLVPVEMAARSSGYIFSHLIDATARAATPLIDEYLHALQGRAVPDGFVVPRASAMYFFYDFPPGVGRCDSANLTQFLPSTVESLAHDRSRLRAGEVFGSIDSDTERQGFEILSGPQDSLTIDRVLRAEQDLQEHFWAPR
jgi:phosphoribosylaminoimidazole carboxylase (NCAIR synthetase)